MADDESATSTSSINDETQNPSRKGRRSRRKEDTSSFSFIHFTGEASFRPGRAQKVVRAQAARASSDRRLATIEKRREAKRANSIDPTAQLSSGAPEDLDDDDDDDNKLSPLSQDTPASLSRARSAPPRISKDDEPSELFERQSSPTADDWICDLNAIVHGTIHRAFRTIHRLQIACDTNALSTHLRDASIYHNPLVMQCLELLAATTTDYQQGPQMSRPIIVLLRHKLIVAMQAAIQDQKETKTVLASVVALLAGWEEEHGEQHACEYHLRALVGLLPSRTSTPQSHAAPAFIDVSGLYMTTTTTDHMPAGFRFYQSLNLLPTSLLDFIAGLDNTRETARDPTRIRCSALAALACRPQDITAHITSQPQHGLIYSVSCHIRIAAALLAVILSPDGSTPKQELLNAWYAEGLRLRTEALLGTVFDEVLIWSLCIFCGTAQHVAPEHVQLLRHALESTGVDSWASLEALLARYIAPTSLLNRLRRAVRMP